MSLDDFAAANPELTVGRPCATCSLPEATRDRVNKALREKSPSRRIVAAWLVSEGHRISTPMLNNHAQRDHHLG